MRIVLLLSMLCGHFVWAADPATSSGDEQLTAPPVALKLAAAFLSTLPKDTPAADVNAQRRQYLQQFLIGFTQPGQPMLDVSEATSQGYHAGEEYRRAKADDLKEVLMGFGYEAREADGRWLTNLQKSSFHAKESPKEEWFIIPLIGLDSAVKEAQEKDADRAAEGVTVHFTGYLSPLGKYGRYGLAKRAFFVTKMGLLSGT